MRELNEIRNIAAKQVLNGGGAKQKKKMCQHKSSHNKVARRNMSEKDLNVYNKGKSQIYVCF